MMFFVMGSGRLKILGREGELGEENLVWEGDNASYGAGLWSSAEMDKVGDEGYWG